MSACLQCDKPKASKSCSRCKSAAYCSKECQSLHWKTHKPLCRTNHTPSSGKGLLEILRISPITEILPPSSTHDYNSKLFVMDGNSKVSSSRLYTFSPATCVLLAVIGKDHVFLQHLSGWNAPGNPFDGNERRLKQLLPYDFKFVEGYVVPGSALNNNLLWGEGGDPILQELLWENLDSMEWKKNLKLLSGCSPGLVFEVSVGNGLRIFHSLGGNMMKSLPFPTPNECPQQ